MVENSKIIYVYELVGWNMELMSISKDWLIFVEYIVIR